MVRAQARPTSSLNRPTLFAANQNVHTFHSATEALASSGSASATSGHRARSLARVAITESQDSVAGRWLISRQDPVDALGLVSQLANVNHADLQPVTTHDRCGCLLLGCPQVLLAAPKGVADDCRVGTRS